MQLTSTLGGMDEGLEINGRVAPITETLQPELVSRGEGRAVLKYPVKAEYTNPMGQLQGGMYAVFMDQAMAMACGGLATATMQFSIFQISDEGVAGGERGGGEAWTTTALCRGRGAR